MTVFNSKWRRSSTKHYFAIFIVFVYSYFYSHIITASETLWSNLARHNTSVELMDIAPDEENFFLAGVKSVIIPWETDSTAAMEPIVPPLRRKILFVLKAYNHDQNIVWHKEYASLPDVSEVYSIAATSDHQLCVVYGGESPLESPINPLLLRLDSTGTLLWYKPIFPSNESAISKFQSNEQIANLDAINVAASVDKSCLLALVTRAVDTNSETFHVHMIRYNNRGAINWHEALPTDLYGATYLLSDNSMQRHFMVTTNLSRDAALEAMILGLPFVPQIQLAAIGSDGGSLPIIRKTLSLSGAWLNGAIVTSSESLVLIGKKRSAWMAHINNDGKLINEYIDNDKIGDGFQAITTMNKTGFVLTHNGFISLFDHQLSLQDTLNIADVTSQSYENTNLSSQLPENVAVEKLLRLNTEDYLLFYKYGSRISKINLKNLKKN